MTASALKALAAQLGFDAVRVYAPAPAKKIYAHRLNERIADDPRELMPDARAQIVLLRGYAPYSAAAEGGRGALISSYYVASHAAYTACREIARALSSEGYKALHNAQVAIKPLLAARGLGKPLRNSLVCVHGLGTRFHAQVLLTDAPIDADAPESALLNNSCGDCALCARACPAGAICSGGRIDIDKCLRAFDDGRVVPEALRPRVGDKLLGCDVCQDVCPRNAHIASVDMPPELERALRLDKLINGDMSGLSEYIGANYARNARLRMKAALIAGNARREDCLEALKHMADNGTAGEREHALWAIARVREGMR